MLMAPDDFDVAEGWDPSYSYELIHGVLVVSPPPSETERDPNEELGFLLREYQYNRPEGAIIDKTLPEQYIHLPDGRRRADRAVWIDLGGAPNPRTDVPAIVVEFVSSRKRDRVRDYEEKIRQYLEIGILEYWIIDRFNRTLTVNRKLQDGPSETVVQEDQTYRTPLLPSFELPLARLL
jgi:Uma2 family endonuclease